MDDNFYAGFNKPSDVHVNLAGEENATPETPAASQPEPSTPESAPNPAPAQPTEPAVPEGGNRFSDFKPAQTPPPANNNYNVGGIEPLNWRGILFIAGLGILGTVILSVTSYFIAGAIYSSNYNAAQVKLTQATQDLENEKQAPTPLELPVVTPPSTTTNNSSSTSSSTNLGTTSSTTGATNNVVQTPIETPAVTPESGQGQG